MAAASQRIEHQDIGQRQGAATAGGGMERELREHALPLAPGTRLSREPPVKVTVPATLSMSPGTKTVAPVPGLALAAAERRLDEREVGAIHLAVGVHVAGRPQADPVVGVQGTCFSTPG